MASTRSTTSTSRKPRSASRAATRPARREEPDAEREVEETEVSPAEAQEIEVEHKYITVELCGEEVQIVPPSVWRSSWQRMLNQGDFDGFAEKIFSPEDFEFYLELDPTIVEFMEFTQEAAARVGEPLGNSRGPAPSSKRTRRR